MHIDPRKLTKIGQKSGSEEDMHIQPYFIERIQVEEGSNSINSGRIEKKNILFNSKIKIELLTSKIIPTSTFNCGSEINRFVMNPLKYIIYGVEVLMLLIIFGS